MNSYSKIVKKFDVVVLFDTLKLNIETKNYFLSRFKLLDKKKELHNFVDMGQTKAFMYPKDQIAVIVENELHRIRLETTTTGLLKKEFINLYLKPLLKEASKESTIVAFGYNFIIETKIDKDSTIPANMLKKLFPGNISSESKDFGFGQTINSLVGDTLRITLDHIPSNENSFQSSINVHFEKTLDKKDVNSICQYIEYNIPKAFDLVEQNINSTLSFHDN